MDFTYGNFGDLGLVEYYIANLPSNTIGILDVASELLTEFESKYWESDARVWRATVEWLEEVNK